ncbi:uncharacterized protein VTP21DRAFT_4178 [Calcarisporiella thermophila]|uniref:uncharacterized protein n=1 Tax=Calcarisporiella thermophila TaxID=911321 RepID=UPI00374316F6
MQTYENIHTDRVGYMPHDTQRRPARLDMLPARQSPRMNYPGDSHLAFEEFGGGRYRNASDSYYSQAIPPTPLSPSMSLHSISSYHVPQAKVAAPSVVSEAPSQRMAVDPPMTNSYVDHFSIIDELYEFYADDDHNEYIDAEMNFRKRELAAREIFSSERSYIQGLRKIRDIFLRPLLEKLSAAPASSSLFSHTKPIITQEELSFIFCNVEQILEFHEQLLSDLEERERIWGPTQIVGDIFLKTNPYLKMYSHYLKNYPVAIMTIEKLLKTNTNFKKFLDQCHEDPRLQKMNLEAHLLLPIQRIPRYKLLIEALLNRTDPLHPDYRNLTKCVSQIARIAEDVNDNIREAENQRRIHELQNNIINLPQPIVAPHRKLLLQGNMFKVNPNHASSVEPRAYFLFTDRLIICKPKEKNMYLFKTQIELYQAIVSHVDQRAVGQPNCFEIREKNTEKPHYIRANSDTEQREWVMRLMEAVRYLNQPGNNIPIRRENTANVKPSRAESTSSGSSGEVGGANGSSPPPLPTSMSGGSAFNFMAGSGNMFIPPVANGESLEGKEGDRREKEEPLASSSLDSDAVSIKSSSGKAASVKSFKSSGNKEKDNPPPVPKLTFGARSFGAFVM